MSEPLDDSTHMSDSACNTSIPRLTVTGVEDSRNETGPQRNESELEHCDIVYDLGWKLRDTLLAQPPININTGHVEALNMKIREVLSNPRELPSRKEGEASEIPFIPLDDQDKILSFQRVKGELKEIFPMENVDSMVQYICGTTSGSSSKRGRKIFAILSSMTDKQHLIKDFYNARIFDGNLPVRKFGRVGNLKLVAKGFGNEQDLETKSSRCFKDWSDDDKDLFYARQWPLLSPFFGTTPNRPPFYALEDGIILPWTYCSPADKTGGNSDVSEIRIHCAHDGFKLKNGRFALKVLHSSSKKVFEAEFEALKKVKLHEHLVPVLAAFTHQNQYYMIFPWAEGGNLDKFFSGSEGNSSYKAPGIDRWVVSQCYGLATALKHIHDVSIPVGDQLIDGVSNPLHDHNEAKIFGRHGDIKPSNVLLFPDEGQEPGILKICDFGLTIFHSEKSRSTDRIMAGGKPLTYSAPETTDDIGISRKLDIWCMGCLYLDFLTWLLLGPGGVGEFNNNRYNEHGSDEKWLDDQFFKRIQRGLGGSELVIKDSVINHISYLMSHNNCNGYIRRFLQMIKNHMLITNYEERIGSDTLGLKLRAILEEFADDAQSSSGRHLVASSSINPGGSQITGSKRRREEDHRDTITSSRQRTR
ncbi:kinase-like protein [Annulohypoxylon moriforme]|nr:kinase-like protein [Annulohypoxylon moriforme]